METGHANVQADLARSRQQVTDAEARAKSVAVQLGRCKRDVLYRGLRLRAARLGIAHWAVGLVGGSLVALVTALLALIFFHSGIASLMLLVFFGYALVGAGAFWLLRARDGENEQTMVQARLNMLDVAHVRKKRAVEEHAQEQSKLAASRQLFRSIQQVANSDAARRDAETNRLLSIDAGRLYPDEFEQYCGAIFLHLGYMVTVTGKTGDQGVDILAVKGQLRIAIQAKRYIGAVGNAAVQEVYAGMAHHRCNRCVVMASSDFTPGAVSLAQSTGCLLVGKNQIQALVRGQLGI